MCKSQCTQLTECFRSVVQSGESAVHTGRKLDDGHEPGGCFN